MKQTFYLAIFFIAFLLGSNVEAQTVTHTDYQSTLAQTSAVNGAGVGVRTGFFTGDDTDTHAWFFGLSGRYRMNRVIGLEAAVDYQWLYEDFEEELKIRSIPITASALIHVPVLPYITPYGIAGAGMYIAFQDFDGHNNETVTEFGFHLGAGLEIRVSQNVAFHGEWKHLFLDDADQFNRQMLNGNAFSIGATYYFRQTR